MRCIGRYYYRGKIKIYKQLVLRMKEREIIIIKTTTTKKSPKSNNEENKIQ